ncbi:hypothetical protein [Desulfospira joergensenii]|uniref:hypothetical protein n=1 Tax=Desulfospira joergensenii TaxID=53329 RepID=UPI0003B4EDAC|nr:hypothetical protein [Desulfospira joergensenii]
MIECKRHNASFYKPDTCIERQRAIAKGEAIENDPGKKITGHLAGVYHKYQALCGGCEVGLKFYQDSLEGKIMETKTETPEKKCASCGEKKPATREYFDFAPRGKFKLTKDCLVCLGRKSGEPGVISKSTDGPRENCHGSITGKDTDTACSIPRNSDKDPIVKNVMGSRATLPGSTLPGNSDAVPEASTTAETKPCAWEKCGKIINRRPEDTDTGWNNRKYCHDSDCARKAENAKDVKRRKKFRDAAKKKIEFDREKATKIAEEASGYIVDLMTALIDIDGTELDRIRKASIQTGIKSQELAIERMGS